jgi:choline-sulfatase
MTPYRFFLLLLVPFLLVAPAHASGDKRPNVLFIAIDDLNDWVGPLAGHPQVKTPFMDKVAKRGTTFTNAHCQTPLCNPSRTSILTGLRPSTTGVYALNPWFRTSPPLADWVTLPQYFAANGYRTLTTGKIIHDAYPPKEGRVDGKEFTVWGYHGGFFPRPKERFVKVPGNVALMDWGVFPDRDEEQDDWKVADWAIGQLKTMPKDKPFFLCVGFRHPHVPCYATQKWFDLYPEDKLIMPPVKADDRDDTPRFSWYLHWKLPEPRLKWVQENKQWKPLVRSYLASVSFVDSQIGRVLEALEASGMADNTIIVIWSDHGWHLGEKGITGKNTLWDRSTRVPLIFAGPGVAMNARCSRPAELLDVYPTLAELCGLPARKGLEGHSLVPQLKNAQAPRPWPAITSHGPNNHGIRSEDWRYIRYADGSEELYDMKNDPNEWTNLAADPRHAAMKKELAKWLPQVNTPPVAGSVARLIEIRDGTVYWEGKAIGKEEKIPE